MTTKTFNVPAENMSRLTEEFVKLNRHVARLVKKGYAASPVSFEVVEVIRTPQPEGRPDRICNVVRVLGDTPKVAGWTFVATLQHLDGGTIIRSVPSVDERLTACLVAYREAAPTCDHCHAKRQRLDTFVVVDEQGTPKQVGRQCLADFIGGMSPEMVAAYAEILESAGVVTESCGESGVGVGGVYDVALDQYLPFVVSAIRTDGWISRTKAREVCNGTKATADTAWHFGLFPSAWIAQNEPEMIIKPTEEDNVRAVVVLVWATETLEEQEVLSDYEHNLRVVVRTGTVDFRSAGIAASLVTYYDRAMGKLAEKKVQAASAHVGEIGKRQVFVGLVVTRIIDIDGEFGTTHLHMFRDTAGNVLKWFASSERLDTGSTYSLKGTVKKHDEYQGAKQTILSRCKVMD